MNQNKLVKMAAAFVTTASHVCAFVAFLIVSELSLPVTLLDKTLRFRGHFALQACDDGLFFS